VEIVFFPSPFLTRSQRSEIPDRKQGMSKKNIIAIGASTGGFEALKHILKNLPSDFPAPILVTLHIGAHESILPELLSPHTPLVVRHARDRDLIEPGVVLIAPPDHHLLTEAGSVRLSHGPKENHVRPAIDPMFRSVAYGFQEAVIGIVLTGNLDDGSVGLQAIKAYGGTAIVQDPAEARASSMPLSAMQYMKVDYCLPIDGIAKTLCNLIEQPAKSLHVPVNAEWVEIENRIMSSGPAMEDLKKIAQSSSYTCPECHGTLWEVNEASPQRFRCHTGHSYTARSLVDAQNQGVEEALWAAIRALQEKESLLKQFADNARRSNRDEMEAEYIAAARLSRQNAETLRRIATT
jgi:two-component system chemotaxis response regulator CheB